MTIEKCYHHEKLVEAIDTLKTVDRDQWKEINIMKDVLTKIQVKIALIVGGIAILQTIIVTLLPLILPHHIGK
jgi:hypothetical protein